MGRTYSDPSFGSKKIIQGAVAGVAINGTNAAAASREVLLKSAPRRLGMVGLRCSNTVIGTQAIDNKIVLCSLLAGTGAAVALGTISLGTAAAVLAANSEYTGSASGEIAAGDTLAWYTAAGTETAANPRIVPCVEYVELFDASVD
jgi:hypothetical protein